MHAASEAQEVLHCRYTMRAVMSSMTSSSLCHRLVASSICERESGRARARVSQRSGKQGKDG